GLRASFWAARAGSTRISTSMESRCLIVRSSGVTPIAATQSMPCIRILSIRSPVGFIERLPACKAGLDVVPILDPFLAQLPAQIHDLSLTHIRKIAESLAGILQKDTHIFDLVDQKHQMRHGFHVFHAEFAITVELGVVP